MRARVSSRLRHIGRIAWWAIWLGGLLVFVCLLVAALLTDF